MLIDSTFKVISHSDIKSACIAGDDVNIVRHKGSIKQRIRHYQKKNEPLREVLRIDPSARLRAKSNKEERF
jgi:hypothetical protein